MGAVDGSAPGADPDRTGAPPPCEGPDRTLLAGCAQVYVPLEAEPSRAPYGFVFAIRADQASGRVGLRLASVLRAPVAASTSAPTGAWTAATDQ
jgi:hypothetical protein